MEKNHPSAWETIKNCIIEHLPMKVFSASCAEKGTEK